MSDKPKGPSKVAQITALRIAQAEERERNRTRESSPYMAAHVERPAARKKSRK